MSATAEIKSNLLQVGNVCCQIKFTRKKTLMQPNYREKVFFGVAEKSFKDRFYNHTKSFTHEKQGNDQEFLKEYWEINFIPKVTQCMVRECLSYNLSKGKCYLCQNEKLEINSYKGNYLWNKRSELINNCRHLKRHMLLRHDSKDLQSFS